MNNAAENAQDLANIEISINEAQKAIARRDALARLESNADFKELFIDGYMAEHAIRQVLLKAHPGKQTEAHQKMFDDQINAVGQFKQYLVGIFGLGMAAEKSLAADEGTREELLAADLTNE